ncbi:ATP-binding protein [Streptomyces sp. NPDC005805]|uniref:ATP-binding protein n=1 Tax=Streptomyces sp. NPDC005805 TaxID=3157068 RepID=UPI003402F539
MTHHLVLPLLVPDCPADTVPPLLLLDRHPESVGYARRHARQFVTSHVPDVPRDPLADVVLVVSELVTNAVRYGGEPGDSVQVAVAAEPGRVRIEVRDTSRRRPQHRPESEDRTRGRGLRILDELTRWGVDDAPFGKVVWAEVTW